MKIQISSATAKAVARSFALDDAQRTIVHELRAIDRSRSPTHAEKTGKRERLMKTLETLTELNEEIQKTAQIRGW